MNKRVQRIRGELKKEISNIILYDIKDPRLRGMASVVNLKVTNDFSQATAYISILGTEEEKADSIIAIKSAAGYIRRELSHRLKLRYVPEIKFEIDDFIEIGNKINSIINKLKQEKDDV